MLAGDCSRARRLRTVCAVMVLALSPIPAGAQSATISSDKTVGLDPMVCASTSSVALPPDGGDVTYCYTVTNTGDVTFAFLNLGDDHLGTILSSFPYSLTPGSSVFVTQTAHVGVTTTNVATWTAAISVTPVATSTDSALVTVTPAAPGLNLVKTVGTDPAACAPNGELVLPPEGGTAVYCYTATNTGNITLSSHTLIDSQLGTLLDHFAYSLAPSASVFITSSAVITQTIQNTADWGASTISPTVTITGTDSALVTVTPAAPGLDLVKTVGTDPAACAPTGAIVLPPGGGTVVYCYRATNTGNVTFTSHTLADSELGTLLNDFAYVARSIGIGVPHLVGADHPDHRQHRELDRGVGLSRPDHHRRRLGAGDGRGSRLAVDLVKTVGTDPSACASTNEITLPPGGGTAVYCYEVTNTGNVTLAIHDLVDDHLGSLLNSFPYSLAPGASTFITQEAPIATTTVNSATWTASVPGGGEATDSDTATVNVLQRVNVPTLSPTAVLVFALLLCAAGLVALRRLT